MNPLNLLRLISTRAHLALGLAGLAVGVVLIAAYIGLVPNGEALTLKHRGSLSETAALTVSTLLDHEDPEILQATLEVVRKRNPDLLSIGVRAQDGSLLVDVGDHAMHWQGGALAQRSTDAEVTVPVWQAGRDWGRVELRFEPLRDAGWVGYLQDPSLKLSLFVFVCCTLLFVVYLRRMLRELDPSRAVPQRVRAAYDTLTEGLLVLDRDGLIVLANRSTGQMLGVDETRLVGHRPREFSWTLADGSALTPDEQPWQRAFATGKPQRNVHLNVSRDDGARFSLRANCSPLADARGGVQAMVVSFQDVTELEKRGEALRIAKEEADAANQAKSQFLANMSHEIRTPMNAILGFTDVLRRSALRHSSDAAKHLDIIQSSGNHLLNLINDILDLSKVESGRFQAERIAFAPHKVASEVVTTLTERAREKGLELVLQFPHALPAQIEGDPARLRQILTNLIGNAIKFTERGSVTVVLRLERAAAGNRYRLDVKDTGIGIAADKLDTVFDPFVQAEASTTRRFGGTGLGLTISRGFARAMGGDIDVQSVLDGGTTFSVWLDAGTPQDVEMLDPTALEQAADTPAPLENQHWQFPPARVLIVDDSEHNRSLVRLLLEEVGLRCEEAENGRVALERVAAEPFDLVLMDMQMPEMDGSTATRTLREQGHTLPIVALTANVMKGFEHELEEAGFSGYQTKPIDRSALMRDLAQRLGGQSVAGEPPTGAAASAALAATPAEPPDDDTPIVSRLAGHARLARIVSRFVAELPERLERMDTAAAAGDMVELAALAHWLKGSGGSMGFDQLYEPSLALEQAAKAGEATIAGETLAELHRLERRIQRGVAAPTNELAEAEA